MTDNEIIKALENLLRLVMNEGRLRRTQTISLALDLINRLQAENERLKEPTSASAIHKLSEMAVESVEKVPKFIQEIKAEAYKECIEKVKDMVDNWDYNLSLFPDINKAMNNLDNLLKELVGDEDES